jgi:hypothetical protein
LVLGLTFTTRFQQAGSFQHATYVVALVTAASALAMLIAPTSFNRLLHRHDLRRPFANALLIAPVPYHRLV